MQYDGEALLQEQAELLAQSTPADINYLHFLRYRLSAQQKSTAQRNQCLRSQQERAVEEEERSTARRRSSGSVAPATYDPSASVGPNGSIGGRGSVESFVALPPSRQANAPPAQSSRPRHSVDDGAAVRGSTMVASSNTPLEDMPASVAKRRSMGDGVPLSLDEVPVTASLQSGALTGVTEQPTEQVQLEACPHCGRTFAPGRLAKHVDTCRRHAEREQDMQRRRPTNRTAGRKVSSAESGHATTASSVDDSSRKNSMGQGRVRGGARAAAAAVNEEWSEY